jgi:hypothetical protein
MGSRCARGLRLVRASALLSLLGASMLVLASATAQASTLTLGLDVEFSGGQAPAGVAPWVTATFDDATGPAIRPACSSPWRLPAWWADPTASSWRK